VFGNRPRKIGVYSTIVVLLLVIQYSELNVHQYSLYPTLLNKWKKGGDSLKAPRHIYKHF